LQDARSILCRPARNIQCQIAAAPQRKAGPGAGGGPGAGSSLIGSMGLVIGFGTRAPEPYKSLMYPFGM
jgi:hypothetical protein